MIEGVLGLNDKREVILSNKMADDIIKSIDKTVYKKKLKSKLKLHLFQKTPNSKNMRLTINITSLS